MRSGTSSPSPWSSSASNSGNLREDRAFVGRSDPADRDVRGRALGEAGEHRAVADLEKPGDAQFHHRRHGLPPADGRLRMNGKSLPPPFGVVVGAGVGVRDDYRVGSTERDGGELSPQAG